MSDYLTSLPVELIHHILDYVPLVDLLLSVSLVNKHLRSISRMHRRSHLDFSCVSTSSMDKSQFDSICTQMRHSTSQVISLTLFDKEDYVMTPLRNDLFFSRLDISETTFPNLRSLILTHIDYETWHLLQSRLPPLITTLSIDLYLRRSDPFAYAVNESAIFNELLFLSSVLKRLDVTMGHVTDDHLQIRPPNPSSTSSIEYLRVRSIAINILDLVAVTPMLRTLQCEIHTENLTLNTNYPRLLYLHRLRIELESITWKKLVKLLSSFPQLVDLVIIADDVEKDMADGFEWARILQPIKHFEFRFEFCFDAFREEPLSLDSFRTNFWTKEKQWFVTYDRNSILGGYSTLYSNSSFHIANPPPHEINATLESESTAPKPSLFPYVHGLKIGDGCLGYRFVHRYNNVKKLYLCQITDISLQMFNNIITYIDTSQIMTCHILYRWNNNTAFRYIEFLRSLPRLHRLEIASVNLTYLFAYQWPHIIDLKIESSYKGKPHVLSSYDIDRLCHSFGHVKRLDIHSSSFTDLRQLLNRIRMISTDIIIRQSCQVEKEQFLTREWIERNTDLKNFHCTATNDFCSSVGLWF